MKQSEEYEDSLKAYRDIKNSLDTALEQGFEKGRAEGREVGRAEGRAEGRSEGLMKGREEGITSQRLDTARSMLKDGLSLEKIMLYTGLSQEEISKLIDDGKRAVE